MGIESSKAVLFSLSDSVVAIIMKSKYAYLAPAMSPKIFAVNLLMKMDYPMKSHCAGTNNGCYLEAIVWC